MCCPVRVSACVRSGPRSVNVSCLDCVHALTRIRLHTAPAGPAAQRPPPQHPKPEGMQLPPGAGRGKGDGGGGGGATRSLCRRARRCRCRLAILPLGTVGRPLLGASGPQTRLWRPSCSRHQSVDRRLVPPPSPLLPPPSSLLPPGVDTHGLIELGPQANAIGPQLRRIRRPSGSQSNDSPFRRANGERE